MTTKHDIPDGPFNLPPDETVDTEFGLVTVRYDAVRGSSRPQITLGTELDESGPQRITYNDAKISFILTLTDEGDGFEADERSYGASHEVGDRRRFVDALTRIANKWAVGKDDTLLAACLVSAGKDILELRSRLENAQTGAEEIEDFLGIVERRYATIQLLGAEYREYRDSCRKRRSTGLVNRERRY